MFWCSLLLKNVKKNWNLSFPLLTSAVGVGKQACKTCVQIQLTEFLIDVELKLKFG